MTKKPIAETTKEEMKAFATELSMLVRATKGLPVEPEEWFSKLINVKNPDERSRFPTYPIIARQVSLRLLHEQFGEKAEACKTWADLEASCLIAYKGLSRKEWVEASKAIVGESQQIYVNPQQQAQEAQAQKRKWYQRKPKTEPSEFANE